MCTIGLNYKNRENLYNKINNRMDKMAACGLVKEAKKIILSECSDTAKAAIGYKELVPFLER
ncbi:MAG: hypothetical protein LBH37_02425 [Oscillospiraceae bacterium]|nr:hypothetical protein [Oscillospiraceae bacterium]